MEDSRRQVSQKHMEILAQFMEKLRPLALASDRSREGHARARWMWDKIARHLNSVDRNVAKTGKLWARYWIDLKFKLRRKYAMIKRCQREGKGCMVQFTPFEERLMKILTDEDGNLLGGTVLHDKEGEWKLGEKNHYFSEIPSNNHSELPMPTEHVTVSEDDISQSHKQEDPITEQRSSEVLKRELYEFELKKQKELYEMEKEQRYERHKAEMEILNLRKQILKKELSMLRKKS